jgi:predicted DNA binding protein
MRYLTIRASPTEGGALHPLGKQLTEEPAIERVAIHDVELLADGTVLLFAEGRGDRDRYEEIMAESEYVDDVLVSGDERWMAVSQFEPTPETRRALEQQRESDLVLETPIHFNDDGSFEMTYLGNDEGFQSLAAVAGDDDDIAIEVLEMGEYGPDEGPLTRLLTSRQQEVLETAVDVGYYRVPRESSLEDVAAAVGIAPTTAGDHLRKVEQRVFEAMVR